MIDSAFALKAAQIILCWCHQGWICILLPVFEFPHFPASSKWCFVFIFWDNRLWILTTFPHLNWMRFLLKAQTTSLAKWLFLLLVISLNLSVCCYIMEMTVSALIMLRKTFVRSCLSPLWSSWLTRCHVRTHPEGLSWSWMLSRQDGRGLKC